MAEKINHTRIRNVIKRRWVDCKISRDLYPEVEKYLIKELTSLITKAKEFMEVANQKSLKKKFLRISDRFSQPYYFTSIDFSFLYTNFWYPQHY